VAKAPLPFREQQVVSCFPEPLGHNTGADHGRDQEQRPNLAKPTFGLVVVTSHNRSVTAGEAL
jgi:hypothetical protein